ncbi:creatininase family protein [Halomicroarcula sp. S3CR25-11]|uniref:Creatininase family protein n=1 Tax=Haloarcula onubensis TaxID=2950539 RepID=A0ABU2FIC7_9EURY|nr:creatininase family protein [Halomicroarcula sp. S3CR25-11]MDS0280516.1 creatininase family protein [Halomicroarcula sp. S3CR25-11]
MSYGGPVETSRLQATHPDLVRENRLVEATAGAADGWGEWVGGVNLAYDSSEFSENGCVGDPGEGCAERGERLLDEATAALVALLSRVAER